MSLAPAVSAAPLVLGFVTRPGLAELVDGKPVGTYFPIAIAAAEKAGLDITLQAVTQPRLMAQIESNQPNYCAIGVFRTPAREASSKFSLPFYRTPRFTVIADRHKEAAMRQHKTLITLFHDPQLKMGQIAAYSFGNYIDPLVAAMRGNIEQFVGTFDQGFAKILAGRFDYIITFPEEFDSWATRSGLEAGRMVRIDYADMPDGIFRHFMCSRAVDDELLNRLNAGIAALHLKLGP
ncbi:MAG: transporter substrate-binding domain-containing protein [Pseudomonadota bacterium]